MNTLAAKATPVAEAKTTAKTNQQGAQHPTGKVSNRLKGLLGPAHCQ